MSGGQALTGLQLSDAALQVHPLEPVERLQGFHLLLFAVPSGPNDLGVQLKLAASCHPCSSPSYDTKLREGPSATTASLARGRAT